METEKKKKRKPKKKKLWWISASQPSPSLSKKYRNVSSSPAEAPLSDYPLKRHADCPLVIVAPGNFARQPGHHPRLLYTNG
jgi:hypothetical protein